MRIQILVICVILTWLNYSTANASQNPPKVYENEQPIEFTANDGQTTDAYEGFIFVPENRKVKNSRKIKVGYVRFPATGKTTGAPIIYLAGGPGGSGIGTAKWRRFPLFMAMREYADVIALDQRGTGISSSLPKCVSQQKISLVEATDTQSITEKYRLAAKECNAFWTQKGIDLLGYTTVQNAWDLNDLRQHFDAKKISLWGISYGSHLALASISLFEQHIDKVILASAEGLDQTVKLPHNTDRYFDQVQDVINQLNPSLNQYKDIKGRMERVHEQLESTPIKLSIPVKGQDPIPFLFQKYHMQLIASMMIADPNQYLAMLLNIYRGLEQQNTVMLERVLARGMFSKELIEFRPMPMAMDIASGITQQRLKTFEQQIKTGLLGSALNFPMPHLNEVISGLDLGDKFRQPTASNVSTLLFSGTLDGRTYADAQTEAVAHLNNVTHIKVINAGHNLFTSSPEVLEVMKSFMQGETPKNKTIKVTPSFVEDLK